MQKRGLEVIDESRDGNCLFRCVAHQLFGDSELHMSVRALCVGYMKSNQDLFEVFISSNFDQYLEEMKKSTTWGDEVEIAALSQLFKIRIEVYEDISPEPFLINEFPSTTVIRLLYVEKVHYDSIVSVDFKALSKMSPGG
jgi:OTU domain-containing protein 5